VFQFLKPKKPPREPQKALFYAEDFYLDEWIDKEVKVSRKTLKSVILSSIEPNTLDKEAAERLADSVAETLGL
jgi:hypothetical protein